MHMSLRSAALSFAAVGLVLGSACGPTSSGSDAGSDAGSGSGCGFGEPNGTRETATVLALDGGTKSGCVGGETDPLDFYEFTAPNDPAGGIVKIDLTNVAAVAGPEMEIFAASDNGSIASKYETDEGKSLSMWVGVSPGAKYRFNLKPFASQRNMSYDLTLQYSKINDAFEPNNAKEDAKSITVGTPIQANAGAVSAGSTISAADAEDWYKVTVAAGLATVKMSNVPSDYTCELSVFNAAGVEIDGKYSTTPGANCQVDLTALTAGEIKIRQRQFAGRPDQGGAGAVPPTFANPYTLEVTQP